MLSYKWKLPKEFKNWSEVDAEWKRLKAQEYQAPYRMVSNVDLRTFLIPEYGEEPYFPSGSNPTLKELKDYAEDVVRFISDRKLDIKEFDISIEGACYYRERGFDRYEPTGDHVCLTAMLVKID